ncbi:hypothetical protein PIIN_09790 [Serendipita indica DSM 11827]|uniref:Uncharacterized protein n=1 Tax=Serendipita indica (strain DSM 11827) TaxID=1109443 RepID=G4TWV9_SERID|nr:hypothetical protein PIIN_09790 [Serendipita indica DSM 11827]
MSATPSLLLQCAEGIVIFDFLTSQLTYSIDSTAILTLLESPKVYLYYPTIIPSRFVHTQLSDKPFTFSTPILPEQLVSSPQSHHSNSSSIRDVHTINKGLCKRRMPFLVELTVEKRAETLSVTSTSNLRASRQVVRVQRQAIHCRIF